MTSSTVYNNGDLFRSRFLNFNFNFDSKVSNPSQSDFLKISLCDKKVTNRSSSFSPFFFLCHVTVVTSHNAT